MIQPVSILNLPLQRQPGHDALRLADSVPCRTPGVDPDMWFGEGRTKETVIAQILCVSCPIKVACLRRGLADDARVLPMDPDEDGIPPRERWGIWGGYTPRMRATPDAKPESLNSRQWAEISRQAGVNISTGDIVWPTVAGGYPMTLRSVSRHVMSAVRRINPM